MKFIKMHGAGNDYLFIDARGQEGTYDWPDLARRMSDRHFGVGSDGIILALPSDRAPVRMRMFNADGSEGEMCGNGIRCFVRYVMEQGIVPADSSPMKVETMAGILNVAPIFGGGRMLRARVGVGAPRLAPEEIPVRVSGQGPVLDYPLEIGGHTLGITCVSMGNPHAVAFVDEPVDGFPLHEVGPQVEHHPLFPNRVNLEVANVEDSSHIKARVWERGSGLTLACGTGACAIGVAARLHDYIGDTVDITLPGGILTVHWPGQGEVFLEGPVEEVFQGEWEA